MTRWPALDLTFQPSCTLTDDDEGHLLAWLHDFAVTAIVDAPHREDGAPAWRVFFASAEARDRAATDLGAGPWAARIDTSPIDVDDERWAERSQSSLRAIQVGSLIVTPPWDLEESRRGAPSQVIITIEPSMGFGTGHHESTRLCLLALQRLDLAGRSLVDLGTGSGVLAIAALRLGCTHAVALDDDVDALEAARRNAELNDVADRLELRHANIEAAEPVTGDVVTANLTGALLRRTASSIVRHAREGGLLILSGFTQDERLAVLHAYQPLVCVDEAADEGWLAITLQAPRERSASESPRGSPGPRAPLLAQPPHAA